MSRYSTTKSVTDSNGKQKLSTNIIPIPPASELDVYIQTTSIERLDLLAFNFYGDSSLWYVIAAANGLGKGSLYSPSNIKLRIPNVDTIRRLIEDTNTFR